MEQGGSPPQISGEYVDSSDRGDASTCPMMYLANDVQSGFQGLYKVISPRIACSYCAELVLMSSKRESRLLVWFFLVQFSCAR